MLADAGGGHRAAAVCICCSDARLWNDSRRPDAAVRQVTADHDWCVGFLPPVSSHFVILLCCCSITCLCFQQPAGVGWHAMSKRLNPQINCACVMCRLGGDPLHRAPHRRGRARDHERQPAASRQEVPLWSRCAVSGIAAGVESFMNVLCSVSLNVISLPLSRYESFVLRSPTSIRFLGAEHVEHSAVWLPPFACWTAGQGGLAGLALCEDCEEECEIED